MSEIILTDQDFDKKIQESKKPILVDFWATWCTPCNMLSPILEKIAKEYEDKITLAKVNVDEARQISSKFGINQIPTVVLFKDGKPVSGFIGVKPEPIVKDWLDKNL
ncbi:MAG: thioredoxin [Xanthomonadaceae bacterium]|nr:thioredoxin [Rhodospirillaceae bacterium]NIA17567.1 thioredoxin [Xanthomonadaceae bacterium]